MEDELLTEDIPSTSTTAVDEPATAMDSVPSSCDAIDSASAGVTEAASVDLDFSTSTAILWQVLSQ